MASPQDVQTVETLEIENVSPADNLASGNKTTDPAFQNFEDQLVQGFLNVVARNNASYKFFKSKEDRTSVILNVISKVKAMPDLGNYKSGIWTPTSDFEKAVYNGFLNNIARKNGVQGAINKSSAMYNKTEATSTADQRTVAIQNALTKVQNMPQLGDYIFQSFTDASKNAYNMSKRSMGKGGKLKTKRRGKYRTKRGGKKTLKRDGRYRTKKGGKKTSKRM